MALVRRRLHRRCSVRDLQKAIPHLPRNTAAAYLRRVQRILRWRRRRALRRLRWQVPGAVWAIDGTWLDQPVEGVGRRALVVVEVHGRQALCVQSVPGERSGVTVACLERLVAEHGAPLVLKADNGRAFTSKAVSKLCAQHGITLLHSPVRRPSYNGACEVGGRWAKVRALAAARARGAVGSLCQSDLDQAVHRKGPIERVDAETRERFLGVLDEQRRLVAEEELQRRVAEQQGLANQGAHRHHAAASLERVAVRRALELCHILKIEGRAYRRSFRARSV